MLEHVVASLLDGLTEREFDAPLMSLLRGQEFRDIHFLHGSYEFGKDFIAKRVDGGVLTQYTLQSKAGDIRQADWNNDVRGQVDMLRHTEVAHPGFDRELPRRSVLVMTGRLAGGAKVVAEDYCRRARERGETELELWDHETLVEKFVDGLAVGLQRPASSEFLQAVAGTADQTITDRFIERVSRGWCASDRDAAQCELSAAVLGVLLVRAHRLDLACYVALCLVRASVSHEHRSQGGASNWSTTADVGRRMFASYAALLWDRCTATEPGTVMDFVRASLGPASMVTYRVRCLRIVEIVGLLGLLEHSTGPRPPDLANGLAGFMHRHPGCSEPISDRAAVSLIPPLLLLARHGFRDEVVIQLQRTGDWLLGAHRGRLGLAGTDANPEDEVRLLLGKVSKAIQPRKESYAASLVLELAAALRCTSVYRQLRVDFASAGVMPRVLTTEDSYDQYLLDGSSVSIGSNVRYLDAVPDDWTDIATHLSHAIQPRWLQTEGRSWDHLAVSSVLRDRHFICGWSAFQ
jgi:hypothetical protein